MSEGYRLELSGAGTLYQYDPDGVLRALPADQVDVSRPFFSAPGNTDTDHDQGDDPDICPACRGDWHGAHCQQAFWTTDEPPAQVECGCTEGACRGEWVSIGFTTPGHGEAFVAPVGTPPPTIALGDVPTFQVLESHVTADGVRVIDKVVPYGAPADERPVGPPIPVYREDRPDGTYVQGSIGPAHPAYAAVRAGLTTSLSIEAGPAEKPADKEYYVGSRLAGRVDHLPSRRAGLPSVIVNGLGREHITNRLAEDAAYRPGKVTIPPELGGPVPGEDVVVERRPLNRAERRALARQARRGHRG